MLLNRCRKREVAGAGDLVDLIDPIDGRGGFGRGGGWRGVERFFLGGRVRLRESYRP